MSNISRALWVKIFYTVILGVFFVMGLMFSFDTYLKAQMFQSSQFKNAAPEVKAPCTYDARIESPLFRFPMSLGRYNPNTHCFSDSIQDTEFYTYKNGKTTTVFVENINGMELEELKITCVSKQCVEDENIKLIYQLSAAFSWLGLVIGVASIISIWFCCSDWCRCCCCKDKHVDISSAYV
ncbi:Hypothetical_protein [Hexamita inflata]|uniref:Hypothetical_protein n=1 Tax=Hexamita inflata TaxID=28002 RepID=A0AA86R7Y6_9EUKA|nr:Hypothetical protein HINF_LOCUS61039 [Hexamita inflata]CAI9973397.1 Hypothetical protein HINF_LOCUS61042 [Hexamita inflata]